MPRVHEEKFIGRTFGRLKVVSYNHSEKYKSGYSRAYWNCICECGNVVQSRTDHLTRGKTRSCGCLLEEYNSKPRGHRTPSGQSSFVKLYCNYKSLAKKKNIAFELTQEQFKELINKDCFYCGSSPSSFYQVKNMNGGILYNGIDRLKSSLGYIEGNVVPCCGFCNRAKLDLDVEEFLLWLDRVKNQAREIEHKVQEVQIAYWNVT